VSLKVLIVADKFKGTLTATEATQAIANGWSRARPKDSFELLPMSDGGDGFGEVLSAFLGARPQTVRTVDAAHRPCEAAWWWEERGKTAIIEAAQVIGLARLPPGKYHPFELDSYGLGALFQAARDKGSKTCLVGIGGSATNDGGFGVARSLGWQFFNAASESIGRWSQLHSLSQIVPPRQTSIFSEMVVAVDVQNPLLGLKGATRIYGPQKGLKRTDFDFCERCLGKFAELLKKELHLDYQAERGAGAAGGLGFGLRSCFDARLVPGYEVYERLARLKDRFKSAGVVITAEGALDKSTLMGKGVGEVAKRCRALSVPCLGLAGTIKNRAFVAPAFTRLYAIAPNLTNLPAAISQPGLWLERLAEKAAAEWVS